MQKLGTENRTPGPKVSGISAPPSPEPAQRDCGLLSSLADGAVLLTCFSVPLGGCPTQTPEGLGQGLVTAKVDSRDSGSRAKPVGRSPRKLGGFGDSDEFHSWRRLVWSPRSARNHQAARCVPPKATASLGRSRRLHLQPPRSDPRAPWLLAVVSRTRGPGRSIARRCKNLLGVDGVGERGPHAAQGRAQRPPRRPRGSRLSCRILFMRFRRVFGPPLRTGV